MSLSVREAMEALKGLGTVEQMIDAADGNLAPQPRPAVNAHIHLPPNFSAFGSVREAVRRASDEGVGVLGVSNYYDYRVYADFVAAARDYNIFPLFGLELIALIDSLVRAGVKINDPGNPGKMYICGKGITRFEPMSEEASRLVEVIRRNDSERMAQMTAKLAELFQGGGVDTGLDVEAIVARVVQRHQCPHDAVYLQERHLAQAFQERLFELTDGSERAERLAQVLLADPTDPDDPVATQNDIRSHLMKAGKPAFVAEKFLDFAQSYRLILELGGIPCYPTLADGASPICPFEQPVGELVDRLDERNIHLAEFIPIRNEPDVLADYVLGMRRAGVAVTAGTEHNTLTMLNIAPTCVDKKPIPDPANDIFWEGACVVAAHQFLTLRGECGFVDARGNPNPDYDSAESRIAAFASLGSAVIEQYYRTNTRQ